MKYEEKLVRSVKNPDGYLWWEDTSTFSYLDGIANDSYLKGTTQGFLTAAIIYHQLTEKILLLLIQYSDLFLKARAYPAKLDTSYNDLDSFGKLIKRHATTVVFSKKSRIIKNAVHLNDLRVQLVHKIHELEIEENIDSVAIQIHDNFERIFQDWKEAMKWFYAQLDLLKSQPTWQRLFEKYSFR